MSTTGYTDPMTGQLLSAWPDIPEGLEPVMRKPRGGEHVETAPAETLDASWLVALDIDGTTLHEDGSTATTWSSCGSTSLQPVREPVGPARYSCISWMETTPDPTERATRRVAPDSGTSEEGPVDHDE